MPFNVVLLVNTCHALGFSACLILDALISFRCHSRAETTLERCHTMLQQIMSHLGLLHVPDHRDEPAAAAVASLDMLAIAAAASDPPLPRD